MYGTAPEMRSLPVRARMRCEHATTIVASTRESATASTDFDCLIVCNQEPLFAGGEGADVPAEA